MQRTMPGRAGQGEHGAMGKVFRFRSQSPEQTRRLGRSLAGTIGEHGVVVALEGPLGAGKTVFVKGLAEGLAIDPDCVSSPTFEIACEYVGRAPDGSPRTLVHADLFRVESSLELEAAGYLDWIAPRRVVAIEWAERFPESLPQEGLWVTLEAGRTPEEREIVVTARGAGGAELLDRWRAEAAARGEGAKPWV